MFGRVIYLVVSMNMLNLICTAKLNINDQLAYSELVPVFSVVWLFPISIHLSLGNIKACKVVKDFMVNGLHSELSNESKNHSFTMNHVVLFCFRQIEVFSSETLRLQLSDMFGSPLLFKSLKLLKLTPHFTPDILNIRYFLFWAML